MLCLAAVHLRAFILAYVLAFVNRLGQLVVIIMTYFREKYTPNKKNILFPAVIIPAAWLISVAAHEQPGTACHARVGRGADGE